MTRAPSQHASGLQRAGITEIFLNYSRPLVNRRQVWGKLVLEAIGKKDDPLACPR